MRRTPTTNAEEDACIKVTLLALDLAVVPDKLRGVHALLRPFALVIIGGFPPLTSLQ